MTILAPAVAVSQLRQHLIDEMGIRRFSPETQRNYIPDVGQFATLLGRSSDTETAEEVRKLGDLAVHRCRDCARRKEAQAGRLQRPCSDRKV